MRFEIEHLESYDNDALLKELRRVAEIVPGPKLTAAQFDAHSKISSSAVRRRFGGWDRALQAAGLGQRFNDNSIAWTREEVVAQIQIVSRQLQKSHLTRQDLTARCGITSKPINRLFGSWKKALDAAGLSQSVLGRRYTDEECFENMLSMWVHYGRPPRHDEMNRTPSVVGAKAYVRRWGTWRGALRAFVERANQDAPPPMQAQADTASKTKVPRPAKRSPRDIPLGLRYLVIRRDGNRCPLCGRSPQSEPPAEIDIDHIYPWAKGGETVLENLRVLCRECNLGKGARVDEI